MRSAIVFTVVCLGCSGQAAPISAVLPVPDHPPREVLVTPDASLPSAVGAACDPSRVCGAPLTCDRSVPGGYCEMACSTPGTPCGDGLCVEQPDRDVCRAKCTTNADCRENEAYACDPQWHVCALANSLAITPTTCPPPVGLGRELAFLSPTELGGGRQPSAIVADDGTLIIVHERDAEIGATRIDPQGRSAPAALSARGRWPVLARDGAKIYAAWIDDRVQLAISSDRGATWSSPIAVDDSDCAAGGCDAPMLAVGVDPAKQGATILYLAYSAGGGIRLRTSHDFGATFSPAKTALPGLRGDLTTDAKGILYAVALAGSRLGVYGTGDRRLDLAISTDGGKSFARPQTLSRPGESLPLYGTTPQVLVDSNRRWLYVTYTRGGRDAKWDLALLSLKQGIENAKWNRTRLADDCATMIGPTAALDPITGLVHVAWYDTRGPRVAHAACTEGLAQCKQLGRLNDQPLAGLSLARHGPTAVGEAQALVADWSHRMLHAVWTQATADGARIVHARAKLPPR